MSDATSSSLQVMVEQEDGSIPKPIPGLCPAAFAASLTAGKKVQKKRYFQKKTPDFRYKLTHADATFDRAHASKVEAAERLEATRVEPLEDRRVVGRPAHLATHAQHVAAAAVRTAVGRVVVPGLARQLREVVVAHRLFHVRPVVPALSGQERRVP